MVRTVCSSSEVRTVPAPHSPQSCFPVETRFLVSMERRERKTRAEVPCAVGSW